MKNLHIQNSYRIWNYKEMDDKICEECFMEYGSSDAECELNRSMKGMYIEWYLHNIGYWLTLPFVKNEKIKAINERFKHVDLEERVY